MPKKTGLNTSTIQKKNSTAEYSLQNSLNKLFSGKPNYPDGQNPPQVSTRNRVQYVNVVDENSFRDTFSRDIKPKIDFVFTNKPQRYVENGKTFYYAVSPHYREPGKYQSFKVFVLPELPVNKLAFRNDNLLSDDMHDYQWLAPKLGGRSKSGEFGAQYQFRYVLAQDLVKDPPKPETTYAQSILFKQDVGRSIRHDKNITEYVASRLMNLFGGDSAAVTFLAKKPSANKIKLPDPTGENIYVGSVFYNNYQDLFRDIERIHGRVPPPDMERPRAAGSWNREWFRHGIMDPVTKTCRFHNLETIIGIALLLADGDDLQSGNAGVTAVRIPTDADPMAFAMDNDGNILLDEFGKMGILVKIDHANALRDVGDEVHMDTFRFWFTFAGNEAFTTQPTNHLREIPTILKVTPAMALELERLGNFALDKLVPEINDTIEEVAKYYGVKPLLEFGERMGADLQGDLREVYLNDDNYNNIKNGKYSEREPEKLKEVLTGSLKAFLTNKITKRMASMRQVAIDMKVSLCFKMKKGYPVLNDKGPFDLKTLLNEHPEYILNDRFHFRSEGQKGIIAGLIAPFNKWRLHNLAVKTCETAAVDILKEFLGHQVIGNSNYQVTFYKSEKDRQILPPIPVGVHHLVVTDSVFKNSIYHPKHKKSAPNLATAASNNFNSLAQGEYGLNFVDSTEPGAKGLYIEQITATEDYLLTTHRLPPELNNRYIFSKVILSHIHPDLLSADPAIIGRIQRIAGKLFSEDGAINNSRLKTSEKNYIQELLQLNNMDAADLADLTREMLQAERDAKLQDFEFEGEIYTLPSKAYLDFAQIQCEAMMLRNGRGTIIHILPEPSLAGQKYDVLDPILTQAYLLVCEKNNWICENQTNVAGFTQQFMASSTKYLLEQADVPLPSPPSIQVK
jgi:hypothetical protein